MLERKDSIFQSVGLSGSSLDFPYEYLKSKRRNAAAVLSYVLPYAPFTKYLYVQSYLHRIPFPKKESGKRTHLNKQAKSTSQNAHSCML
jgi:hypothetical protein